MNNKSIFNLDFNILFDQISYMMCVKSPDDRFINVNKAFLDFFKLKINDVIGNESKLILPIDIYNKMKKHLDYVVVTQSNYVSEEMFHVEENQYWFEIQSSPIINEVGQIVGIFTLSKNISKRKSFELELEKSRSAAETANLLKSQFVANMSHEIRTPMHAILGYTELLKEEVMSEEGQTYLSSIQKAGSALMGLLNDILDLSKIESGNLEIQYSYVDVTQLLNDVYEIFKGKTDEKGLLFNIEIDQRLPQIIQLDEMRFKQIIFNLVGNSVKFTLKGQITIKLEVIDIDINKNLLSFKTSVKDSGIGIPESQFNLIFEPFVQQDGQSNKKYGGSGLGLSISKRLVELMGGELSISSQVGIGSEFCFTLANIEIIKFGETKKSNIQLKSKTALNTSVHITNNESYSEALLNNLSTIINSNELIGAMNGRLSDYKTILYRLETLTKQNDSKELYYQFSQILKGLKSYDISIMKEALNQFVAWFKHITSSLSK